MFKKFLIFSLGLFLMAGTIAYLGCSKVVQETGTTIDTIAPLVSFVTATSTTAVDVIFSEAVEETTAETIANYTITGSATLAVTAATLAIDKKTVSLTTASQSKNKTYTITIQNIKDLSGNVMTTQTGTFATYSGAIDITTPTFAGIKSATAVGTSEIIVSWEAASDNVTSSGNMVYLIYEAALESDVFTNPTHIEQTMPGATQRIFVDKNPGRTFYFGIRASDEAVNLDPNTVVKAATTEALPGSAMYSYRKGSPAQYASLGYHFVGIKSGGLVESNGIIRPEKNGLWIFCYSNGITFEGIRLEPNGKYVDKEISDDLYETFKSTFSREVSNWLIDTPAAFEAANRHPDVISWKTGKDESKMIFIVVLTHSPSPNYNLEWNLTYDYNNQASLLFVNVDARAGNVKNVVIGK